MYVNANDSLVAGAFFRTHRTREIHVVSLGEGATKLMSQARIGS